jgi:hypothetical protein
VLFIATSSALGTKLLRHQRPPKSQPVAHLYGQPLVLLGEDIDELLPVDQPDPPEAFLFGFLADPLRPEVAADLAEEVCKLACHCVGLVFHGEVTRSRYKI